MSKKNRADIVQRLGKEFEYVRIDNIKKDPVLFFEAHSVDLCIKAYEILRPKRIYINYIPCDFLRDPLFADLHEIRVSAEKGMDISPLHALTNLKSLWLTFNPGDEPDGSLDFSQFPNLTSLHYYWLKGSKNLTALQHIKSIFIEGYPQADLNTFTGLTCLNELELRQSSLKSLDGVATLPQLESLKILGSSHINSLEHLAATPCASLKQLELNTPHSICGLKHLENFEALQTLNLGGMPVVDCSDLEHVANLNHLGITHVKKVINPTSLSKLSELTSLKFQGIDALESLDFLTKLPKLTKLDLLPWFVTVNQGYLPLIQMFRSLNKLESLFKWDDILEHLDEEGKKAYREHLGDSPLEFIKREFKFHSYEDFSPPYTEENCAKVDEQIGRLIDTLIKHIDQSTQEKLKYFETTVNALDKIDNELNLFATGEREYLWDTLDRIAAASGIDVATLEESASKNNYFKWPVI